MTKNQFAALFFQLMAIEVAIGITGLDSPFSRILLVLSGAVVTVGAIYYFATAMVEKP